MIAHDRMVNGRNDLLIVILKEKINVDKLPPDLRVYISKYRMKKINVDILPLDLRRYVHDSLH